MLCQGIDTHIRSLSLVSHLEQAIMAAYNLELV